MGLFDFLKIKGDENYPLKNKLYCLYCGNEIMPFKNTGVRYYRCRGNNKKICTVKTIRADVIEKKIFNIYVSYFEYFVDSYKNQNINYGADLKNLFLSIPDGIMSETDFQEYMFLCNRDSLNKLSKLINNMNKIKDFIKNMEKENFEIETDIIKEGLKGFTLFIDYIVLDTESGQGIMQYKTFNILNNVRIKFTC
ncbi:MAG TPA: zinc ribbon domain-containing protein [Candidatus Eremiobacteraeota bacterium]|nr:zinc ribbon domain-containing protein [Candidatus Eremiobacteraeota bacterium]